MDKKTAAAFYRKTSDVYTNTWAFEDKTGKKATKFDNESVPNLPSFSDINKSLPNFRK